MATLDIAKDILRHRGIISYRSIASLRAEARGFYLGYIWWLLEPLLNTAVYYVIFGIILGSKTPSFIAYLLLGTIVYQWFQTAIFGSIGTVYSRAHIYRQIPLPKYLFSHITVFTSSWRFSFVFLIVFSYILISGNATVTINLLYLPLLACIQIALIVGAASILCLASTFVKDLDTLVHVVFRAGLFLSAIFWDASKVPENLKLLFYANPAASMIQGFRDVILHGTVPNPWQMIYCATLAVILLQMASIWHRKCNLTILKNVQS